MESFSAGKEKIERCGSPTAAHNQQGFKCQIENRKLKEQRLFACSRLLGIAPEVSLQEPTRCSRCSEPKAQTNGTQKM
jgi:hypothetical protein